MASIRLYFVRYCWQYYLSPLHLVDSINISYIRRRLYFIKTKSINVSWIGDPLGQSFSAEGIVLVFDFDSFFCWHSEHFAIIRILHNHQHTQHTRIFFMIFVNCVIGLIKANVFNIISNRKRPKATKGDGKRPILRVYWLIGFDNFIKSLVLSFSFFCLVIFPDDKVWQINFFRLK